MLSDLRSSSWEDGEGKSYRFKVDARTNDADPSPVDGIAERSGDHITVKLKQPEAKTFTLDGATVFPTEQIQRIIAAAKEGKSLLELTVYDGSDNGQKVYNTLSVIGQPIAGTKQGASPDASTSDEHMKALTRWPVTVSYYDRDAPEEGRRADAGLFDVVRALRERRLAHSSCSTTMISSSPARSASSTSRTQRTSSRASDGGGAHPLRQARSLTTRIHRPSRDFSSGLLPVQAPAMTAEG